MKHMILLFLAPAVILSGCGESGQDVAEDRMEAAAEKSAVASGAAVAALGLTEAELLDAELVGTGNVELGDVMSLSRGADGSVDRLLIEVENSRPDRFVYVPITGLTVVTRGNDRDLATTMTMAALAALPNVEMPPK